jgi:hypothetical protein
MPSSCFRASIKFWERRINSTHRFRTRNGLDFGYANALGAGYEQTNVKARRLDRVRCVDAFAHRPHCRSDAGARVHRSSNCCASMRSNARAAIRYKVGIIHPPQHEAARTNTIGGHQSHRSSTERGFSGGRAPPLKIGAARDSATDDGGGLSWLEPLIAQSGSAGCRRGGPLPHRQPTEAIARDDEIPRSRFGLRGKRPARAGASRATAGRPQRRTEEMPLAVFRESHHCAANRMTKSALAARSFRCSSCSAAYRSASDTGRAIPSRALMRSHVSRSCSRLRGCRARI